LDSTSVIGERSSPYLPWIFSMYLISIGAALMRQSILLVEIG
jgi:hypothetical protein